ncbi:hypothetical protein L1987_06694 [Smallanthus sonchifolius]|uniref:Uncharacterized protein n=1 Tax=Smallanthus sonchifolius TaxID=185202 RepID=A0ACB9JYU3_9ASTR|nr:hypothetical protein L1987_06694 [Smallanthus sonchifolius]
MGTNSLEQVFGKFCKGVSLYGPFWDHMFGYWQESLKNPEKNYFLTYEEMKEQPSLHLRKLADFLGCQFSSKEEEENVVESILKICSFDNLSNLNVNKEGKLPSGENNSAFFRKGEPCIKPRSRVLSPPPPSPLPLSITDFTSDLHPLTSPVRSSSQDSTPPNDLVLKVLKILILIMVILKIMSG